MDDEAPEPPKYIQVGGRFYDKVVDDEHLVWVAPFEVNSEADVLRASTNFAIVNYKEIRKKEVAANRKGARLKVPNLTGRRWKTESLITGRNIVKEYDIYYGFGNNGVKYKIRKLGDRSWMALPVASTQDILNHSMIEAKSLPEMSLKLRLLEKPRDERSPIEQLFKRN
jgi:hypothetical protein